MRSANAIKVHRKSGEAERRDLRFRGPFLEMFFDRDLWFFPQSLKALRSRLVRKGGLEPPWVAPPDPKSGASANFATFAFRRSRH
jgi:hypothetical protein